MESINSKVLKKTEIEVNLDLESSTLYIDGSMYELEEDVLEVIDTLMTELSVLEVALLYNVGANLNAKA